MTPPSVTSTVAILDANNLGDFDLSRATPSDTNRCVGKGGKERRRERWRERWRERRERDERETRERERERERL
jgi:hypothetical protein